MFSPLTREEITQVVEIQFAGVRKMMEGNGMALTVTPAAVEHIAALGFDPQYGARPIKRVIQKLVLNELSRMILSGKIDRDSEIEIDVEKGALVFGNK
jgi:ATP-dependent Clp protease ATP-binding subunit ClpB